MALPPWRHRHLTGRHHGQRRRQPCRDVSQGSGRWAIVWSQAAWHQRCHKRVGWLGVVGYTSLVWCGLDPLCACIIWSDAQKRRIYWRHPKKGVSQVTGAFLEIPDLWTHTQSSYLQQRVCCFTVGANHANSYNPVLLPGRLQSIFISGKLAWHSACVCFFVQESPGDQVEVRLNLIAWHHWRRQITQVTCVPAMIFSNQIGRLPWVGGGTLKKCVRSR